MQKVDEVRARLHHGTHELIQVQQLVATASDRFRTVVEEILDTQQILRRTMEEHQARLTEMVKAYEELTQHIGSLERFNDLLKSKTNEMKEQYESTIIENVDLRDVNTGLKDTVRTLQNTPGKSHNGLKTFSTAC